MRVSLATPASSSDAVAPDDGSSRSAPQFTQKRLPSGSGLAQWAQSIGEYDTAPPKEVPAATRSCTQVAIVPVTEWGPGAVAALWAPQGAQA